MVRYLDNKVVTIKGERYTEIKDDAEASKEDAKKTFVALKPARQYRFHWQAAIKCAYGHLMVSQVDSTCLASLLLDCRMAAPTWRE